MTEEQKSDLINAHRVAADALAHARLVIQRVQDGRTDPDTLEDEQAARRLFNEADKAFMDLVLSL